MMTHDDVLMSIIRVQGDYKEGDYKEGDYRLMLNILEGRLHTVMRLYRKYH